MAASSRHGKNATADHDIEMENSSAIGFTSSNVETMPRSATMEDHLNAGSPHVPPISPNTSSASPSSSLPASASLHFANQAKLANFSPALRKEINALNVVQYSRLRYALGLVNDLVFLAIPPELRREIYRHILIPPSGAICRSTWPSLGKIDIAILLTCHQIKDEALDVLFRGTRCNFSWDAGRTLPFQRKNDKPAMTMARTITLKINLNRLHISFGSKGAKTVGYMLNELVEWYETAVKDDGSSSKPVALHVEFGMDFRRLGDYGNFFDPNTDASIWNPIGHWNDDPYRRTCVIWLRAQFPKEIRLLRDKLADVHIPSSVPGEKAISKVTLTTNAEFAGYAIPTRVVDSKNVRCLAPGDGHPTLMTLLSVTKNVILENPCHGEAL